MNLLVFQRNHDGRSVLRNGNLEVRIIDPKCEDWNLKLDYKPDMVLVSKELELEERIEALRFGYKITGYQEGNLSKVKLI